MHDLLRERAVFPPHRLRDKGYPSSRTAPGYLRQCDAELRSTGFEDINARTTTPDGHTFAVATSGTDRLSFDCPGTGLPQSSGAANHRFGAGRLDRRSSADHRRGIEPRMA